MKKILTLFTFIFIAFFASGQTPIDGVRKDWSDIRFIINENFDTIYSRVDSLDLILITDTLIVNEAIGIGVSHPLSALHVAENARIDSNLLIGDSLYITKIDQDFANGTFFISNRNDFSTLDNTDAESAELNTYIGYNSGLNSVKGKKNTTLGYGAGENLTDAFGNTFLGYKAGATGTGIFSAGTASFYANTFVGSAAGLATTTGSYNAFFGVNAGLANTTGFNNTFLGVHAGDNNISGTVNVAVGTRAGFTNTVSSNIVSIGNNAGFTNTAANNIFIGTDAGYFNTTAANNVTIGYRAGYNNLAGASNVFIGNSSGFGGSSGNYAGNVFIGDVAGTAMTASCNFNVGIGKNSGDHITGGDNNTLMGYQSGDNITTGSTNIIIGSGVDADVATSSNQLNIGNIIKGDMTGGATLLSLNQDSVYVDTMSLYKLRFSDGTEMTTAVGSTGSVQVARAEVLHTNTIQTTVITLPATAILKAIMYNVFETFDGSGTDLLDIGITGTPTKYFSSEDVTTIKDEGFDFYEYFSTSTNITFTYNDQNADATQGKAYVYVFYSIFL